MIDTVTSINSAYASCNVVSVSFQVCCLVTMQIFLQQHQQYNQQLQQLTLRWLSPQQLHGLPVE